MTKEEKIQLQKEYENFSDEGLLIMAGLGKGEYQEGVYEIILGEIKKRGLEDQLNEINKIKKQEEADYEHDMELVKIKQFSFRHEAELVKGILEEQGIEVFMSADDCGGLRPELSFTIGVELSVKKEDVKKAEEVLKDLEKDS